MGAKVNTQDNKTMPSVIHSSDLIDAALNRAPEEHSPHPFLANLPCPVEIRIVTPCKSRPYLNYSYTDDYTDFIQEKIIGTKIISKSRLPFLQPFLDFANNYLRQSAFENQKTYAENIAAVDNPKSLRWLREIAYNQFHVGRRKKRHNWPLRRKKVASGKWGRK
jgi:hypothetical protein